MSDLPEQTNIPSWHYSQETQSHLSVSVAQLKSTLEDGSQSVNELTESFVELANTLNGLINHKTDIDHTDLTNIKNQIEQGIIAFQFYDRISQRLEHVSNSLISMGELMHDTSRRVDVNEWQKFSQLVQIKYSMETERKLYRYIMSGMTVDEALQKVSEEPKADNMSSIELF